MSPPARHDLLHLTGPGWRAVLRRHPVQPLAEWAARDHPLVGRRRHPADPPGSWPAALTLPPGAGRARLALCVDPGEVARVTPPPPLAHASAAAPASWQPALRHLVRLGDQLQAPPRVFGSLLWQHLTGHGYLTGHSDLDLLWPVPANAADLPRLLAVLLAEPGPPRLDGEVVFAGGAAVHWRELAAAGPDDDVLVKSRSAIRTVRRRRLLP